MAVQDANDSIGHAWRLAPLSPVYSAPTVLDQFVTGELRVDLEGTKERLGGKLSRPSRDEAVRRPNQAACTHEPWTTHPSGGGRAVMKAFVSRGA